MSLLSFGILLRNTSSLKSINHLLSLFQLNLQCYPDRLTITRNITYTSPSHIPHHTHRFLFFFYINDKHFGFLFTILKSHWICNYYDRNKILIILFWHFRNLRWNIWYPHVYCQWRHCVCWRLMGSGGMEESHRSSVGR